MNKFCKLLSVIILLIASGKFSFKARFFNKRKSNLINSLVCVIVSLLIFAPSYLHTNASNLGLMEPQSSIDDPISPLTVLCTSLSFSSSFFTAGIAPFSVAIGDIDGDGKADLATVDLIGNTVSVLRNTGSTGTTSFAAKVDFSTGSNPTSVAIGDIDGDGKADLAIANNSGSSVSILRNTSTVGSITFIPQVTFSTGSGTASVAIRDIDGDGKVDLATANQSSTITVLRNTSTIGSITFEPQVTLPAGSQPFSIVAGDIDGDGKADLAAANRTDNSISVLRNVSTIGSITFAPQVTFSVGTNPQLIAIGDIDGDGQTDLATANRGSSSVSVLRNVSTVGSIDTTSFVPKVDFSTGSTPESVAIGDIDGDGQTDLATANRGSSSVSVLRNLCGATTATSTLVTSNINPSVFGQLVTFTATVTPQSGTTIPTGMVQFFDGATSLGTATLNASSQASIMISTFSVGNHSITATYNGNTTFDPSTSTAITQVVNKANTTTLVTSNINPSVFGQSVTFTATVTAVAPGSGTLTGMVQFMDGATLLGSSSLNASGQAQLSISSLSVATHSITAMYLGNINFNTSTSIAINQVVNKANTATALTANPSQIIFGQTVTFTATVTAVAPGAGIPSGSVQFNNGANSLLGTANLDASGIASLSVALTTPGANTITAIYSGDTSFNTSTSNSTTVFVASVDHNTLYAADTLNNRVQRSTNNGVTWQVIGNGAGRGIGQFAAPKSVAANFSDSLIFVADTGNNRVQRSTNGGTNWTIIAAPGTAVNQVNRPAGLAYDEVLDILYIADTMNNRILAANGASTAIPSFTVYAEATAGTAIGKVQQPQSIAVNSTGMVYVADTANNRIQVNTNGLSTGWIVIASAGTQVGQINTPKGIYVDNSGKIWVADTANNRIQVNTNGVWSVFMSAGTAIGSVNNPEAVVVNLSGKVFIADTANNRIQFKPVSGGNATIVGNPGLGVGQFNKPSGIR